MKPVILINLKTYKSGRGALSLAKAAEAVDRKIIVAAQPTDVYLLASSTRLRVFCQHADEFEPGRATGYITLEAVKAAGAKGVLLNHSEHPIEFLRLKKIVKRARKLGLKTAVFAKNLFWAKKIKALKPDYLIIEPPELIAGKISVTKAKPSLIKKISRELKYPFLVGAGIKDSEDIKKAVELGARGAAFASVFTKAKNPRRVLEKILRGV